MILDSSAVVAILLREPDHARLLDRLDGASVAAIGTPTLVETGLVLCGHLGIIGKTLLARFMTEADLVEIPFTAEHWPVAVDAYLRYGKSRHPARLNFGDCLTYAVCRLAGRPLLCVGKDFPQTDLEIVS